jgi:ribosomal protein L16 Arg81 hydroxylase
MKLWILAPGREKETFNELFGSSQGVNVTKGNEQRTAKMVNHQFHCILQQPGDLVFIPGGWWHCVKNLTDTMGFGGSFLRPWCLSSTIEYAESVGPNIARSIFDIDAIFAQFAEESTANLGITDKVKAEIIQQWTDMIRRKRWPKPR